MTAPLFEDHSFAGYDHDCHDLTIEAAQRWGLDPHDPADRQLIIRRLSTWLDKLRLHTPATPRQPDNDQPF